jgi:hypothetical protein
MTIFDNTVLDHPHCHPTLELKMRKMTSMGRRQRRRWMRRRRKRD